MATIDTLNVAGTDYDIQAKNLYLNYPVGSVFIMSTNTDPATVLGGGTWELIDKEFAYYYSTEITQATANADNTTAVTAMIQMRNGHSIYIQGSFTPKVVMTDSTLAFVSLPPANFGLVNWNNITQIFTSFSDGGNVVVQYSLTSGGNLRSVDVLQRNNTAASVAVGSTITFQGNIPILRPDSMLDSACDRFYFKRTA